MQVHFCAKEREKRAAKFAAAKILS
jgi:hypothetical protein